MSAPRYKRLKHLYLYRRRGRSAILFVDTRQLRRSHLTGDGGRDIYTRHMRRKMHKLMEEQFTWVGVRGRAMAEAWQC
jgi:hypothetical protein